MIKLMSTFNLRNKAAAMYRALLKKIRRNIYES